MKIKAPLYLLFAGILLTTSCSQEETVNLYSVSFDELDGFTHHGTIKKISFSHSGNKCVQLNKDNLYGPTYSCLIGDIGSGNFKFLKVTGWVRIETPNAKMQIVCSVDSADKTVYWDEVDNRVVNAKPGEWKKLEKTFDLSKVNSQSNKLNIYPMHDGEGNSYIDDLTFSFE